MCSSAAAAYEDGEVGLQDVLQQSLDDHLRKTTSTERCHEEEADVARAIENSMSGNRYHLVSEMDLAIQNSLSEAQQSPCDVDRAIRNSMADVQAATPTAMVPLQAQHPSKSSEDRCIRALRAPSQASAIKQAAQGLSASPMPIRPTRLWESQWRSSGGPRAEEELAMSFSARSVLSAADTARPLEDQLASQRSCRQTSIYPDGRSYGKSNVSHRSEPHAPKQYAFDPSRFGRRRKVLTDFTGLIDPGYSVRRCLWSDSAGCRCPGTVLSYDSLERRSVGCSWRLSAFISCAGERFSGAPCSHVSGDAGVTDIAATETLWHQTEHDPLCPQDDEVKCRFLNDIQIIAEVDAGVVNKMINWNQRRRIAASDQLSGAKPWRIRSSCHVRRLTRGHAGSRRDPDEWSTLSNLLFIRGGPSSHSEADLPSPSLVFCGMHSQPCFPSSYWPNSKRPP